MTPVIATGTALSVCSLITIPSLHPYRSLYDVTGHVSRWLTMDGSKTIYLLKSQLLISMPAYVQQVFNVT